MERWGGGTNWQTDVSGVDVSGVSVLLDGGDWVALPGSSLIRGHVIPFKHQIPVKAYHNTHTQEQRDEIINSRRVGLVIFRL